MRKTTLKSLLTFLKSLLTFSLRCIKNISQSLLFCFAIGWWYACLDLHFSKEHSDVKGLTCLQIAG